jgi:hypothetical protein
VRLNKIATVDKSLVVGSIGAVSKAQITELNQKLKLLFQIP